MTSKKHSISARFTDGDLAILDEMVEEENSNRSSTIVNSVKSYQHNKNIEGLLINLKTYIESDFKKAILKDVFEILSSVANLTPSEKKDIEEKTLRKLIK